MECERYFDWRTHLQDISASLFLEEQWLYKTDLPLSFILQQREATMKETTLYRRSNSAPMLVAEFERSETIPMMGNDVENGSESHPTETTGVNKKDSSGDTKMRVLETETTFTTTTDVESSRHRQEVDLNDGAGGAGGPGWGRGIVADVKRTIGTHWKPEMLNFNQKTIAVSFFLFFACIAPAITFGAIYEKATQNWIGGE